MKEQLIFTIEYSAEDKLKITMDALGTKPDYDPNLRKVTEVLMAHNIPFITELMKDVAADGHVNITEIRP